MKSIVLSFLICALLSQQSCSAIKSAPIRNGPAGSNDASGLTSTFKKWIPSDSMISTRIYEPYDPPGRFRRGTSLAFELDFAHVTITSKSLLAESHVEVHNLLENRELLAELVSLGSTFLWWRSWDEFNTHHKSWVAFNAQDTAATGPNVFVQSFECDQVLVVAQSTLAPVEYGQCDSLFDAKDDNVSRYSNCVVEKMSMSTKIEIKQFLAMFETYIARC